ncbi:TPA: hypothetical protein RKX89_002357 [Enterobacter ludwigii]|nr:hypothetical protein [Enterobacter ludwigii]
MSKIDKQALRVPEREKHDWSQAVMRDCDFCQQWALTVRHSDGGYICASCCDSEYTTALSSALAVAIERAQAAEKRIAELQARPANPIKFKENADADYCRGWAWNEVKKELGTDTWTVGDNCTYYGFFCWGWDSRRQYNEQRAAGTGNGE